MDGTKLAIALEEADGNAGYGVIQEPIDRLVYRLTRGTTTASSFLGGVEITMLTTTGARTGRTSTLPVLGVPDGDDTILVASNYGRPRNPAWYHNLRANPHARIPVLRLKPLA